MHDDNPPGIFRGWLVLAGLFITMAVTSGLGFYAQGVVLDALVVEQGFSVSVAGAGTGIFFATSGIAGYFAGGLLSKFDARLVMTIGSLIGATGLALLGQVRNETQMVIVMIIFGIGFALTSLVPGSTIVTRWFVRKRSVALSIASSGLSLGGIAITPVIATIVLISVTFIIVMAAQVGAIQHTFKMTKDRIDIETARTTLMVLSGTSVVARIVGGIVALKVSVTRLTAFLMGVQSLGIAILAVSDTTFMVLLGAVILGTSMGNLLMFHPLLLADAFGIKDYARIYGMGSLLMIIGVGTGPFLVGFLRDVSSYRTAFGVLTVLAITGLVFLAAAGKPPSDQTATTRADLNSGSQKDEDPSSEAPRTLTPPHRIEQPSTPPNRRVAVIDRGSVMSDDTFEVSESAAKKIPLKSSE